MKKAGYKTMGIASYNYYDKWDNNIYVIASFKIPRISTEKIHLTAIQFKSTPMAPS